MKSVRKSLVHTLLGLAISASIALPISVSAQTIRMWTFLNPAGTAPREKALAEMIREFESANAPAKIAVEQQIWSQLTPKFLAAHGAGNAPDLVWVENEQLGEVLRSGAFADLSAAYINKWPQSKIKERTDSFWNRCTDKDKVRCMVMSRNYISILYRKDILQDAGIDPNTISTWESLRAAAKKLTVKDASGAVARWGYGQQFSENQADPQIMVPMMLGKQSSLFQESGKPNFATAAGIEALRFQTDMVIKDGVTPPQSVGWTSEDLYEQFIAGRIAMMSGASVRVSTLQGKMGKEKVGLMLWPSFDGTKHSPGLSAGWAVGVWEKSKNKEVAAKFLEHMTSDKSDRVWVSTGGQLPFVPKLLQDMKEFSLAPENAAVGIAAMGISTASWVPPLSHPVSGFRQVLNKAAQQVITSAMDPKLALEEAERSFSRQNSR